MSDSAGRKTSAKRKSPAAGKDSGAQKQRKERTRRRIRLMYWGNSSSSSLVYIIPDFSASANFCRIFFRWQQMTTIGIQCSIRQPVQYSSAGIRNPVFRQQLFAARRLFIQANEASRQPLYYFDRPVLSRPPYLLYRANLRLPFANNPSFQAPSAPATTFQEP